MTNKMGSTAFSFTQQLLVADPSRFVVGGLLYAFEAGTTTPVQPYKDQAGTLLFPNPITLGADGRIPLVNFIMAHDNAVPGTFVTVRQAVRMRLTDQHGVIQFDEDPVPLMTSEPGTGGGGGGVDTTDPDALYKTGDMKVRYGVGQIPGYVRANGLTIGATGSGATELQDTVLAAALYSHLWNSDANLVVLGGRGLNASADFTANKQLTLPDFSGRALAFLDNMSGTPRNVLTTATFSTLAPTVLGAQSGTERHTMLMAEMPAHDHDAFINDPGHTHSPPAPDAAALFLTSTLGGAAFIGGATGIKTFISQAVASGVRVKSTSGGAIDDKVSSKGSGLPHLNIQPTKLVTCYIRL